MIQQTLAGQMDCDQGGGTRSLHGKTGTRQIELIGHTRREHILVVAGLLQQEQPRARDKFGVSEEVVYQVGIHARSGINADSSWEFVSRPSCILDRFPGTFEKEPMLRIHDRSVPRAQSEEGGVEAIDVVKNCRCSDVVRIFELGTGPPRRAQLLIAEYTD